MTLALPDRLVLATHNKGKLAEFEALLGPRGVTLIGAADAGLEEPEETETTFEGNAALKAEAAMRATGLAALADDSGLAVDELDGAPGVYSARWAGPTRDFGVAMAAVLDKLTQKGCETPAERNAHFIAVLALAMPGEPVRFYEGRTEGHIAHAPRGSHGFGYDPIFIPHEADGRTFGEMTAAQKHGEGVPLSHRARAVAKFERALG